jgi:signal recognition particle receptor subunit beta
VIGAVVGSRSTRQISFVGPFGVGKTTAVFTLCGASVSTTEVTSSMVAARLGRRVKPTTTVGLELGEWTAPDGGQLTVVGTPGQERFDVVRRSAMPRSMGVVLWLFGGHEYAVLDARLWLEFISKEVPASKITVAVTRLGDDPEDLARFEEIRATIARTAPTVPVVRADPRERDDVERLVLLAAGLPAADLAETRGIVA